MALTVDLETVKQIQAISRNEGNRHKEKRVSEQVLLPQERKSTPRGVMVDSTVSRIYGCLSRGTKVG